MVLEGRAFGSSLGGEGGPLLNGIKVLVEEIPQSSLTCPATWGHSEKVPAMTQEEVFHLNTTTLAP